MEIAFFLHDQSYKTFINLKKLQGSKCIMLQNADPRFRIAILRSDSWAGYSDSDGLPLPRF